MQGRTASQTTTSPRADVHSADVPALTGLRAFAALAVVVFHLRGLTDSVAPRWIAAPLAPFTHGGMLGVDVFFVLSGFVIAHTYSERLATLDKGTVRPYVVARLARVYPLHLATFLAFALLVWTGATESFDPESGVHYTTFTFVGNLLMLQAFPGVYPWNFPAWSVSCELAAYTLFPLFAARLARVRWPTALVLAVLVMSLQLCLMHQLASVTDEVLSSYWPRIAGEFTAGTLLWVVWRRALRPGRWADAVVVLCVLVSLWLLWNGVQWLLCAPLLAVTVVATACAVGPVARLLSHPVTRWLGRVSYALYLVHVLVLLAAQLWVIPDQVYVHRSATSATLVLGVVVLTMVAAAAVLHHGIEEPARRWMRRRFGETGTARP